MGYLDKAGLSRAFTKLKTLIDAKADKNHTHSYAGSSSAGGSANSAVKLATARTIGAGTAVTSTAQSFNGESNITIPINSVKESYLDWGGRGISGGVSPVGMALSSEHSVNRLAFINGDALTVEYSSNGGSTYTDYGYSASDKSAFCTQSKDIPIGRASASTSYTTSSRTRITINAQPYVYTNPRKLLINVCSSGGMQVLIEYKTGASGAAWQTFGTYNLSGWSGWNDVPLVLGTLGGGSSQTGNNWYLRMTFIMTSVSSSASTTASVLGIRLFGQNDWSSASYNNNKGAMSSTGHLYSYDINANATFPAQVTATAFNGTATRATKLSATQKGSATQPVYINSDGVPTATTYTLEKSVPLDAKFTDTNTWRGVQNNLTSTATDQSLSAYQGKVLNDKFSSYVPTSRTVNGKALSSNITLSASDVGASASDHTHNYAGSSSAGGNANWANGATYANYSYNEKPTTTAGTGAAYTASVSGLTLVAGASFIMVPHTVSTTTTPTLNVNSLGAKNIRMRLSSAPQSTTGLAAANFLAQGRPVKMIYDGTQWIIDDMVRPSATALYGTVPISGGGTGGTTAAQARQNLGITTANNTVLSQNADYAEVGEWADGNTNNENRIGYFVAIDNSSAGATMVKAESTSDVRGVTVAAPAFSGNCSSDKFGSDGELLKQYDYVAVMGMVPVIDNGKCTINGRCMPTDDGTAVPSPNNMGYQIIDRIDSTHVLIAVEPEADMMVRIKEDVEELQEGRITRGTAAPTSSTGGYIYIQYS